MTKGSVIYEKMSYVLWRNSIQAVEVPRCRFQESVIWPLHDEGVDGLERGARRVDIMF